MQEEASQDQFGLSTQLWLIIANKTWLQGLESLVKQRGVHRCLPSPWWFPSVFQCLPWCCDNLGNYSKSWATGRSAIRRLIGSSRGPSAHHLQFQRGWRELSLRVPDVEVFQIDKTRDGDILQVHSKGRTCFTRSCHVVCARWTLLFAAVTFQSRCHRQATAKQAHVPVWLIRYPTPCWRQNINSFPNPTRIRYIEIWRLMTFSNWGCANPFYF